MITKNYLYLVTAISYFVGLGGGYILRTESSLYSGIISIFFGLTFSVYVVPMILGNREEKQ